MDELRQKILILCNESGLPLEAIIYVVKDVWRDAEMTLLQMKQQQPQQTISTKEETQQEEIKE